MAKTEEQLLEEELASLSPEELEEYEKELQAQSNLAPSAEQMEQARAEVEPTTMEAVSAGIVSSVPGLKQGMEAYDAMAAEMQEDDVSFDDVYGKYKDGLDETNKTIAASKEQAPVATGLGEVVGTGATLVAGGVALKGAGAGRVLTERGMGYATAASVGAAQQMSQEDTLNPSAAVRGAAIGVAAQAGGELVGKGIKAAASSVKQGMDKVQSMSIKRLLGVWKGAHKQSMEKTIARTGQTEDDFLRSVISRTNKEGNPIINFKAKPSENVKSVKSYMNEVGNKLDDLYSSLDDKAEVDLNHLKEVLKQEHASFSGTEDAIKLSDDMARFIDNLGVGKINQKFEIKDGVETMSYELASPDKVSVKKLHQIQKTITEYIERSYERNTITVLDKHKQALAASLRKANQQAIKGVDDQVYNSVRGLNKEYSNMSVVKDSLNSMSKNENVSSQFASLTDIISIGIGSQAGPVGAIAAPAIKRLAASPKTHLAMAKGYNKVASIIEASPMGEIASRIATASLMNSETLETELNSLVGEINLKQSPVARNSQDVQAKQMDIRHIIRKHQPESLGDFDKVMASGDPGQIGAFMDQMSKTEGVAKFFETGVGFDGIAHTAEDRQMLEEQLKMHDMPASQRMNMLESLRSNGIVPQLDQVQPTPQKVYVPKPLREEDY
jgi:hypothetical protein